MPAKEKKASTSPHLVQVGLVQVQVGLARPALRLVQVE